MNASTKTLLPLELALMGEPGYFWCDSDFLETISASMKSVKVAKWARACFQRRRGI
jgi:hypothetical protein